MAAAPCVDEVDEASAKVADDNRTAITPTTNFPIVCVCFMFLIAGKIANRMPAQEFENGAEEKAGGYGDGSQIGDLRVNSEALAIESQFHCKVTTRSSR